MDMYLMGRVFRSFSTIGNNPSSDPLNIIILTGAAHTEVYRNILGKIGFKQIEITNAYGGESGSPIGPTSEVPFRCIDIRKFKQPFFSTT